MRFPRRFSLRTLLLAMTVIAVAIFLVCRHYETRHERVEALVAKGARLTFSQPMQSLPRWKQSVAKRFGEYSVLEVRTINFMASSIDPSEIDAELVRLEGLPDLRSLDLTGTHISDNGLKSIATLAALEELTVDATSISLNGLMLLKKLPRLKQMLINGDISDLDVKTLREAIPNCQISNINFSSMESISMPPGIDDSYLRGPIDYTLVP